MLEHKDYKYRATIDWIEFEITTASTTNFQTVKRIVGNTYVLAVEPEGGGAATNFRFRIQDVTKWSELDLMIAKLNHLLPTISIKIVGIELSFDAYLKQAYDVELYHKKAVAFYHFLHRPCSDNHRSSSDHKYSAEGIVNLQSVKTAIENNRTLYIGSAGDPISQRIYFKTMDRATKLPEEKHRARYEITLTGDECPFHTLEQAKAYQFSNLAKWFKFRKYDATTTDFELLLTRWKKQQSMADVLRRAGGGKKVGAFGTVADTVLNDISYRQLKNLTLRLKG